MVSSGCSELRRVNPVATSFVRLKCASFVGAISAELKRLPSVGELFPKRLALTSEGVGGVVRHDSEPLVDPQPYFKLGMSEEGSFVRQQDGQDSSDPTEGTDGELSETTSVVCDTGRGICGLDCGIPGRWAIVLGTAHVHVPVSSQLQDSVVGSVAACFAFPSTKLTI